MTWRTGAPIEFKFAAVDDGDNGEVEGYGAIFDERDLGGDVIAPGAFARTLASGRRIKMLWQHDPDRPVGVWHAAEEDARGLKIRGRLLDTQLGREARTMLKAGALDGLSIGYRAVAAENVDGARRLTEVELWEVSLVTFPMQPAAMISDVKGAFDAGDLTPLKRLLERTARDAGLSAKEAKAVAAGAAKELTGARDVDRQLHEVARMLRATVT